MHNNSLKIGTCYRLIRRILVGGVLYQAEVDFSRPSTNHYTLTNGGSRIWRRTFTKLIVSVQNALLGGSGGMPPRKILDFRPSEIVSGTVSGQIS